MIFLNLILKEIKLQLKSVTFYVFCIIVLMFYFTQYNKESIRFKAPEVNTDYEIVEVTSEEEKLVIGYKELYGILKDKEIEKYTAIDMSKKIKLTDNQIEDLKTFVESMSLSEDPLTVKAEDIKIDYDLMISYMDSLDSQLRGNTVIGPKYRQFLRPMTYEEALIDYEKKKSDKDITDNYGRILADYLGLSAGLFVVFISAFAMPRDKNCGTLEYIYSSKVKASVYIGAKFIGLFISIMSVFLVIGVIETIIFLVQANIYQVTINSFGFIKYIIAWVAPTVMFVIAVSMLISVITENSILPIVIQLGGSLILIMNTKLTGAYDFTRFVIRFNKLEGNDYFRQFARAINYNRIFYVVISGLIVFLTMYMWTVKRNKGMGVIKHGN